MYIMLCGRKVYHTICSFNISWIFIVFRFLCLPISIFGKEKKNIKDCRKVVGKSIAFKSSLYTYCKYENHRSLL